MLIGDIQDIHSDVNQTNETLLEMKLEMKKHGKEEDV